MRALVPAERRWSGGWQVAADVVMGFVGGSAVGDAADEGGNTNEIAVAQLVKLAAGG